MKAVIYVFQRGTNEIKKYLCSRMEPDPSSVGSSSARSNVQKTGNTGVIGGTGINLHDVQTTKTLTFK